MRGVRAGERHHADETAETMLGSALGVWEAEKRSLGLLVGGAGKRWQRLGERLGDR